MHDDLGQVVARDAGDVAVADTVLRDEHVVAQARGVAGGCRNADVCLEKEKVSSRPMCQFNGGFSSKTHHVSSQHELRTRLPAQILLQLRVRKRTRVDLANHLLTVLGLELLILLRQLGIGRENRRAVGSVVDDVHDLAAGVAVLLEQRGDGLAGRGRVGDLQLALCVLVLRVDDD